jgi:integrase
MTLKVERTVNSVPGKGIIELPTKSAYGNRTIPIDSEIVGLLSQLSGRAWVFSNEDGNPIDATVDSRRWRALLVEAGVRYLALHAARHTVATHLMQRGVNPRAVQLLLGHSSPAYTLATYVHPGLGELRMALLEPVASQPLLVS